MRHEVAPRWEKATMASIEIPEVLGYAEDMEELFADGMGLLLMGPPGVGKSWAMAALTFAYRRQAAKNLEHYHNNRDYVYIQAPDMFDAIPVVGESVDTWRKQPYLKTLTEVNWLVINDLGKEYRGGKLDEQVPMKLGRVLRTRNERKLPTFITTNLNPEALAATYGNSIISNLRETCDAITVGGKDRRGERRRSK